jgi:thioredoxin-related protein
MEETTLKNDQTARFINNNFNTYKINALSNEKIVVNGISYTSLRIGKYDFHELAAELLAGNMSFPSVVFLDENFNKIVAEKGYSDSQNFDMILSYYAGNHYKKTIWKRYVDNYCRDSHFNSLVNNKKD